LFINVFIYYLLNVFYFFYFFQDVKKEYYDTFVNGYFGQNVIKLVNKHIGNPQVVTLDQAIAMGCLENCPIYFPTRKVCCICTVVPNNYSMYLYHHVYFN